MVDPPVVAVRQPATCRALLRPLPRRGGRFPPWVALADRARRTRCRPLAAGRSRPATASVTTPVTAIDPVPSVPVRCIEVDAPSRLYLAGEAMVPTHNSLLASAFGHYFLVADGEAEPEVYIAAAARGQAGIVLGQAPRIGLQSPLLRRHLRIQTHLIECPRNGGLMRALPADAALQHGLNPSANIIDELHADCRRGCGAPDAFRSHRGGLELGSGCNVRSPAGPRSARGSRGGSARRWRSGGRPDPGTSGRAPGAVRAHGRPSSLASAGPRSRLRGPRRGGRGGARRTHPRTSRGAR